MESSVDEPSPARIWSTLLVKRSNQQPPVWFMKMLPSIPSKVTHAVNHFCHFIEDFYAPAVVCGLNAFKMWKKIICYVLMKIKSDKLLRTVNSSYYCRRVCYSRDGVRILKIRFRVSRRKIARGTRLAAAKGDISCVRFAVGETL